MAGEGPPSTPYDAWRGKEVDGAPSLTRTAQNCAGMGWNFVMLVEKKLLVFHYFPHSAIPISPAIRGVAFNPEPVITSTVVCSAVIVPVANSFANATATCALVGST